LLFPLTLTSSTRFNPGTLKQRCPSSEYTLAGLPVRATHGSLVITQEKEPRCRGGVLTDHLARPSLQYRGGGETPERNLPETPQ
jgi:hypothetical protein